MPLVHPQIGAGPSPQGRAGDTSPPGAMAAGRESPPITLRAVAALACKFANQKPRNGFRRRPAELGCFVTVACSHEHNVRGLGLLLAL